MSNVRNTWYIDDISNTRSVLTNTTDIGIQSDIVNRVAIVVSIGEELNMKLKERDTKVNLNDYVGAIEFRFPSNEDGTTSATNIAFRQNVNISQYPISGERVFVTQVPQGMFLYTNPINYNNDVNNNIAGGFDESVNTIQDTSTFTAARDNQGYINTPTNTEELSEEFERFLVQEVVPVKFKPGDVVIEGRYSNFMTFTKDSSNYPIIMIGTNASTEVANTLLTNQNTIMISSRDKVVIPPFKRNVSVINYTEREFSGNQIILMSDRIYLGSKAKEMFLMSNSHIHMSSDQITSIDASDLKVKSNMVQIDASLIALGKSEDKEPAAKADALISILQRLLSLLTMDFHTVSGSKTMGSANAAEYKALSAELSKIKSKEVRIS